MTCQARPCLIRRFCAPIAALALLGGCSTLVDVATAPVKAAGKVADWATTSQDEADRNRGRELRRAEERYGKLQRRYADQREDCARGDVDDCEEARKTWAEMEQLRAKLPPPPPDE